MVVFLGKTHTRKPQARSDVHESDSSAQQDLSNTNNEASDIQTPPKAPPRQRGKRKVTEDPKKQPTPLKETDLSDSCPEPAISPPIRKRGQTTITANVRARNTETRTTVEIHPQPSTSKQQPPAPVQEKSPGKNSIYNLIS